MLQMSCLCAVVLVPGFAVVALDDGLHTDEGFLELLDFFQLEVGILHHLIDVLLYPPFEYYLL